MIRPTQLTDISLSDIFDCDEHGVGIPGSVPVTQNDTSFIQLSFPLHKSTVKYAKSTTSMAVYVQFYICCFFYCDRRPTDGSLKASIGYLGSIVAAKQNAARFG